MRVFNLLSFAVMLVTTGATTAHDRKCPELEQPPAAICVATSNGLVYADTHEEARSAADALDAAALAFAGALGKTLPPGLLVLSATFSGEDAARFAASQGFGFSRSWLSAADKRTQMEVVLRNAMPGAEPAVIERALAGVAAQHADTLQHELGHTLHRAAYWPGSAPVPAQYGTPAPDWLDEATALLVEGPALRGQRETFFTDALRRDPSSFYPLVDFLDMEHPVNAAMRARLQAQGGTQTGSGVQVMAARGHDAQATATFYAQSLAFAQFLIDTSDHPQILAPISEAIAGGIGFDSWLATDGARHGLPGDMPALQAAWDLWTAARLAATLEPAG